MKIQLISPLLAPKRAPATYNIGLGYIAASLIQDKHSVSLLDIEGHRYTKTQVCEFLKKMDCDAIGIGTLVTGYRYLKWLVKEIRKTHPSTPIWVGNSIGSTIPEILLTDMKEVDVVVVGEGDITVKELARATENHTDLSLVKGIYFRKNGEIVRTPDRELIQNIDEIPFPQWDLFPQHIYMNNKTGDLPNPIAFIVTTRGCPYRCTYCYHPFQAQKIRSHSARRTIEEIKYLQEKYHIKSVCFADDLFIANKKRVFEFCDLLVEEGIKIKWAASGRVNLMDEELLLRMKKAGCITVGFGIESGSQVILDNIKKQAKVEQGINAIKLCQKVGIPPNCSFMIGNVGETRKTVAESVWFILNYVPHLAGFFITTPYPGTELFEYGIQKNKITDQVKLFESYGEQSDLLLVNFTDMSDEELIALKHKAEQIIKKRFFKRYPYKGIFILMQRSLEIFKHFFQNATRGGFIAQLFKLIKKLRNHTLF